MNPYSVLGLSPYMSEEEAKKKYRLLCKQNHPDVGGNHERFLEIQEAWKQLTSCKNSFGKTRSVFTHKSLFNIINGGIVK